jgi:hypothetical protein
MEIKEMNIFEKMSAITNELGVVAKNLNVDMGGGRSYKAVQEKDILDAVKPLEEKYRVYSYPVGRTITDRDILVKESEYKEKITRTNTLFMRIEVIYRFVNMDNTQEYIDTITYGDGLDTGDKAPGKAMTYADKYALMKAYKIATGDDPDKDASPEHGYSKLTKEQDERLQLLDEIQGLAILKSIDIEKIRETFKVEDLTQMTTEQMKKCIVAMQKKGN